MVEHGRFTPTEEGTPQGGVISPVLMNVALHGMETAAGVRYSPTTGTRCRADRCRDCPVVVRYADDLVALCHAPEQAEQVKARLAAWLAPRGLAFNEDKTRIVSPRRGLRLPRVQHPPLPQRQAADQAEQGGRADGSGNGWPPRCKALHGANAEAVITTLNPIIRGWAAYYRTVVSKRDVLTRWTTTCGGSPTGGPSGPTRTSRSAGSSPGTSARSTRPGGTAGCSATATAAATWSSSPGHRSSGTRWSRAARLRTTPP